MGASRIFSLASAPDGSFLAGGYDGVWRSTDGAASWAPVSTGLTAAHVFAVAAARGVVYGGTGDGLVRSGDGGRSWEQVEIGLDGRTVYCVAVAPEGRVLAGTSAGCLVSTDTGSERGARRTMG